MTSRIGLTMAPAAMIALAACNTVNGADRDLRSVGAAVSDASGQPKQK